ncbi:hypothetical protein FGO68_gene6442 [Halteria grandinella]|uniref:Uncharacterized protein n=1 Tax=Halteria grandinella TaxID=5974 RepID=A0A8J8NB94_HALGN|nr:hypothetical protein FGO68_gene6442 [Halteria grandinella]
MCAVQHAAEGEMFAIYLSQEDEQDRVVRLNRRDLKDVKVIGIIASVQDDRSQQIVNLAYEPFILQGTQRLRGFGVRLRGIQFAILAVIITSLLLCLGMFIYCMRKRGQAMIKKLTQPHYSSQVDESTTRN